MKSNLTTRTTSLVLTGLAVLGISACGDSTGPDGPGAVDVVMYDGSSASGAAPYAAAASDSYSGTFSGDVTVEVSEDGATWVDVTSATSTAVTLQSEDQTTVVDSTEVNGGSYSHVRITLHNASAHIDSGATIDGNVLSAVADISIGGGSDVVIEKEIFPFTVAADTHMVIMVDLNSEAWVDSESVNSGTTTEAAIDSATTVDVHRR